MYCFNSLIITLSSLIGKDMSKLEIELNFLLLLLLLCVHIFNTIQKCSYEHNILNLLKGKE